MDRMLGKTPERIEVSRYNLYMEFVDGTAVRFYHNQECCEDVHIEDVIGDWNDLIGHPLLVAEARQEAVPDCVYEAAMWTFYTFRSIGGTVDVRWHGSSSGYYSVSVTYEYQERGGSMPREACKRK